MSVNKVNTMQSATHAAATILAALVGKDQVSENLIEDFRVLRDTIASDLEEVRTAEPEDAPIGVRQEGMKAINPATVRLKPQFKKHANETLEEVWAVDPSYVEWLATKSRNQFINRVANEFLATAPARPVIFDEEEE